jgi:membrane protein implicated in regulation of membrane protease activity
MVLLKYHPWLSLTVFATYTIVSTLFLTTAVEFVFHKQYTLRGSHVS